MTKTPTAAEALTLARAEHDALSTDLSKMRDTLAATEADLAIARRSGDAKKQRSLASDVAALRELVAGQEGDVKEAAERLSAAAEEARLAERQARADDATRKLAELDQAMKDLEDEAENTLRDLAHCWSATRWAIRDASKGAPVRLLSGRALALTQGGAPGWPTRLDAARFEEAAHDREGRRRRNAEKAGNA